MLHIATCKYNIVPRESDILAERCTASNICENMASTPGGAAVGTLLIACSAGLVRVKGWENTDIIVCFLGCGASRGS